MLALMQRPPALLAASQPKTHRPRYCRQNNLPMASKIQQFATNINCSSCVRSVTAFLDDLNDVIIWRVDVDDPRKVLTVEGTASEADIIATVEDAGFDIRPLATAA